MSCNGNSNGYALYPLKKYSFLIPDSYAPNGRFSPRPIQATVNNAAVKSMLLLGPINWVSNTGLLRETVQNTFFSIPVPNQTSC